MCKCGRGLLTCLLCGTGVEVVQHAEHIAKRQQSIVALYEEAAARYGADHGHEREPETEYVGQFGIASSASGGDVMPVAGWQAIFPDSMSRQPVQQPSGKQY